MRIEHKKNLEALTIVQTSIHNSVMKSSEVEDERANIKL